MPTTNTIRNNWPRIIAVGLGGLLIVLAYSCAPTVPSPVNPETKLTRPELQIEMEHMLALYEIRQDQLEQKERIRELVLQNAMAIGQSGSIDPVSILTTIAAFYGIGSAANSTKNIIQRKKTTTPAKC